MGSTTRSESIRAVADPLPADEVPRSGAAARADPPSAAPDPERGRG